MKPMTDAEMDAAMSAPQNESLSDEEMDLAMGATKQPATSAKPAIDASKGRAAYMSQFPKDEVSQRKAQFDYEKEDAKQGGQWAKNLLGGGLHGASRIGNTLATGANILTLPVTKAINSLAGSAVPTVSSVMENDAARRDATRGGVGEMGVDMDSGAAKTGDILAQIAGTAGIPIPFASGAAGVLPRIVQAFKNVPLGAAAGGAQGFVAEGQEGIVPGMAAGGAMAGGLEGAKAIGASVGGVIGPHLSKFDPAKYLPEAIQSRARQYLPKGLQGETTGAERSALHTLSDPRVGEVEKAGLRKLMESHNPTLAKQVKDTAENAERSQLERLAQGATQEEAMKSSIRAKQALNDEVVPKMNIELNAANTANVKNALEERASRLAGAATNKVQDVRRFTDSQERAGKAVNQYGDPLKYIQETVKNKAENVAQKAAESSLPLGEGAKFAKSQADSLAAYGLTPLRSTAITDHLDDLIKTPSIQGTDLEKKLLEGAGKKLRELTARDGTIDAYALAAFRKSGVNGILDDLTRGMEKPAKEHAQGLLIGVKTQIDDAFEKAGGTEWRDAMQEYSKGMKAIDQQGLSATALKLHETSPQKLVDLSKGNAPEIVEGQFGNGKFSFTDEMNTLNKLPKGQAGPPTLDTSKSDTIKRVAEAVGKRLEADELGSKGAQKALKILRADEGLPTLPGVISWKISTTNKIINALSGKGGEATNDALAKFMLSDTARMEKLMQGLPKTKQQMLLDAITQRALVTAPAAAAATNTKER